MCVSRCVSPLQVGSTLAILPSGCFPFHVFRGFFLLAVSFVSSDLLYVTFASLPCARCVSMMGFQACENFCYGQKQAQELGPRKGSAFVEDVTAGMSRSGRLEGLEVSSFQLAVQGVEMREALGVCSLPLHGKEGASKKTTCPEIFRENNTGVPESVSLSSLRSFGVQSVLRSVCDTQTRTQSQVAGRVDKQEPDWHTQKPHL